jgi:hypothetical protein
VQPRAAVEEALDRDGCIDALADDVVSGGESHVAFGEGQLIFITCVMKVHGGCALILGREGAPKSKKISGELHVVSTWCQRRPGNPFSTGSTDGLLIAINTSLAKVRQRRRARPGRHSKSRRDAAAGGRAIGAGVSSSPSSFAIFRS